MIQNSELVVNSILNSKIANSNQATIAYFILVHRFPEQFKRLFIAIYDPSNVYLIHLDKKTSKDIYSNIKVYLSEYKNVFILDSENVVWGGYSMVQAELNGMKFLLQQRLDWDFFVNLSGQDYPLKSQKIIREYLGCHQGCNFIKIANQFTTRPETMNRIDNFFLESKDGFVGIPYKRAYLKEVTPYIGGQWMILTRAACEFICTSPETIKFEEYYLNTLIADESFFQTFLMNSSFDGHIINDDKRAIIWIPDGDIKLRPKTFAASDINFLTKGSHLFARKFDDQVDADIINLLVANFDVPLPYDLNISMESIGAERAAPAANLVFKEVV